MSFELAPDPLLESTTDALVDQMPEPQPHAINEAIAAGAAGSPEIELDAMGVPWNREDHALSADGLSHPKTAKGLWKKRKRRKGSESILREPGSSTSAAESAGNSPGVASGPTPNEVAARQTGQVIAAMFLSVAEGIGGPEWKPRTESAVGDETQFMTRSFGDYCVAKNYTDLSPGFALCFAMSIYCLPRFSMPRTQEKAKNFFGRVKERFYIWKARRAARKNPRAKVVRIVGTEQEEVHETDSAN